MSFASEQNPMPSLFSTPADFDNPEFHQEVEMADIIIGLDDQTRSMEIFWGAPISERLQDKSTPKIIYLKTDLEGKESERIRNEVRRLKSSSSNGSSSPLLHSFEEGRVGRHR